MSDAGEMSIFYKIMLTVINYNMHIFKCIYQIGSYLDFNIHMIFSHTDLFFNLLFTKLKN